MMEFLDKIYGYEHFGIFLFAAIAILVVLFLIVLFFGKKDEKKRELERTQQMAQPVADGFANVSTEPTPLNITEPTFAPVENIVNQSTVIEEPVIESTPITEPQVEVQNTPIIEPIIPVEPITENVEPTPVLSPIVEPTIISSVTPENYDVIPETKVEEIVAPEPVVTPIVTEKVEEIKIPNFNFDELAASIANELNELENSQKEIVEPIISEEVKPEPIINNVNETPVVTPINEVVKPIQQKPVTFSSVYINKPAEPVINEAVTTPVIDNPQPVQNPGIELPKPAEMPALNKDVTLDSAINKEPVAVPDFSQFEGESYNIK